jgi:hypothetical protein
LLRGDSLADTGPLASLIARHVDGAVAARVFLNAGVYRWSFVRERANLGPGREDV